MVRNKPTTLSREDGIRASTVSLRFHELTMAGCLVTFEYVSLEGKQSTVTGIPLVGLVGSQSTQSVRVESVNPDRPGVRSYRLTNMSLPRAATTDEA